MNIKDYAVGEKYYTKDGNTLEITKIDGRSVFYHGLNRFVSGVCDFESFAEKVTRRVEPAINRKKLLDWLENESVDHAIITKIESGAFDS